MPINTMNVGLRVATITPFQQQVTYRQRVSGDTFSNTPIYKAHRKIVDDKESGFSEEILMAAEMIWQITSGYLGSIVPVPDDKLVDSSGVEWVILGVLNLMNGQVFEMACRQGV